MVWNKAIYWLKSDEYLKMMCALSMVDVVYMQYYDTHWGLLSTPNLRKFFNVKIVPTLQSFVSVPQTGEWDILPKLPSDIHFMDFRILDLYLKGVPFDEVPQLYFAVLPKEGAIEREIKRTTEKYRNYFRAGNVIMDYSEAYESAMAQNLQCYFTFNHPDNSQLSWMLNGILNDIMGSNLRVEITGPQMIGQFRLPSLLSNTQEEYVIKNKQISLIIAARIFYMYFNTVERDLLIEGLRKSTYFSLMDTY